MRHKRNLSSALEKKQNMKAIFKWKREIKTKGGKARDLDFFVNKGK